MTKTAKTTLGMIGAILAILGTLLAGVLSYADVKTDAKDGTEALDLAQDNKHKIVAIETKQTERHTEQMRRFDRNDAEQMRRFDSLDKKIDNLRQ